MPKKWDISGIDYARNYGNHILEIEFDVWEIFWKCWLYKQIRIDLLPVFFFCEREKWNIKNHHACWFANELKKKRNVNKSLAQNCMVLMDERCISIFMIWVSLVKPITPVRTIHEYQKRNGYRKRDFKTISAKEC